jgi:hypothetical protein
MTIAREEKDEVKARQDEFLLLQAKQGIFDPEAKHSEWHKSVQRMHPSFVCLQAWS